MKISAEQCTSKRVYCAFGVSTSTSVDYSFVHRNELRRDTKVFKKRTDFSLVMSFISRFHNAERLTGSVFDLPIFLCSPVKSLKIRIRVLIV